MNAIFKTATALALAVAASSASAATFECLVNSDRAGIADNGAVYLRPAFGGTFTPCNVVTTVHSVSPDICKGWISHILTAKGLAKPVVFHFDTAHPANQNMVAPYCSAASFAWDARVPYFIEIAF